ncbi:MAG: hypothetical protein MZW92_12505 [Comamonadaceae bacterium]|nr:hypothetical protein [Comamonadaceae bacterium]
MKSLIRLGMTSEAQILKALETSTGVRRVSLANFKIDEEVLNMVDESFCPPPYDHPASDRRPEALVRDRRPARLRRVRGAPRPHRLRPQGVFLDQERNHRPNREVLRIHPHPRGDGHQAERRPRRDGRGSRRRRNADGLARQPDPRFGGLPARFRHPHRPDG